MRADGDGRKAMGGEAFNLDRNPFWALFLGSQSFHARMLELSAANLLFQIKFCSDLARAARSPSEISEVVVNTIRDQFEAISEQIEELSVTARSVTLDDDEIAPLLGD